MPKRRRSSGSPSPSSGSRDDALQPGDTLTGDNYRRSADLWAAADLDGTSVAGDLAATNSGLAIDLSKLITHQEVFLRILGFLNAADLASVQGVSRYWQSMSLDQQVGLSLIVVTGLYRQGSLRAVAERDEWQIIG